MTQPAGRLLALDRLRGLIMVLMALDHASAFLGDAERTGEFWGGAFPVYTDALPFVVRAVTHLCAPGFFFLMGCSMVLLRDKRVAAGESEGSVVRHLMLRGAVLIALQHLVVNPAWLLGGASSGPTPGDGHGPVFLYFGVLFALGAVMIGLAPLLRAPVAVWLGLVVAGLGLTVGLTPDPARADEVFGVVARLLSVPGESSPLMVRYPVLPWIPFAALGLAYGRWLGRDPDQALRGVGWAGLALVVGFIGLRVTGLGELNPPADDSWIAWLNLTKYPPSPAFFCLTLGANGVLLAGLSRLGPADDPLASFGRGALFFYGVHLYLYGLLGRLFGQTTIAGMLPFWAFGLVLLLPLTRWWVRFKGSTPPTSWWRLL